MKFSQWVVRTQTEKKLSREKMAQDLRVAPKTVEKWEADKAFPSPAVLKRFSDTYQVSMAALYTEEDIRTERLLQDQRAGIMNGVALFFLAIASFLAVTCYYLQDTFWGYASGIFAVGYVAFSFFAHPRYRRIAYRRNHMTYVLSRVIIAAVILILFFTMRRWQ